MRNRRLHTRIVLSAALACTMLVSVAPAASAKCRGANLRPANSSERVMARATVCLLNKARTKRGLHRLRLNPRLSAAARNHSRDMVRKQYFDHVSRSGRDVVDRLTRTGYLGAAASWVVGENLAWGAGSRSTPREIMSAWMRSSGHRRNILTSRFREVGIGIIFDTPTRGLTGATYTTTFGARG